MGFEYGCFFGDTTKEISKIAFFPPSGPMYLSLREEYVLIVSAIENDRGRSYVTAKQGVYMDLQRKVWLWYSLIKCKLTFNFV